MDLWNQDYQAKFHKNEVIDALLWGIGRGGATRNSALQVCISSNFCVSYISRKDYVLHSYRNA
jgi:hypothetical protein